MTVKRLIPPLLCVVVLTGCASGYDPVVKGAGCAAAAEGGPAVAKTEPGGEATAPKIVHRVEPLPPRGMGSQRVVATVEAIIGVDGKPRHVCIASGHPEWGRAVAAAVRQWVFEPGLLNGKPADVQFEITATRNQ